MMLISLTIIFLGMQQYSVSTQLLIRGELNRKYRSITVDILNNRLQQNNMPRRPHPPILLSYFHRAFANLPLGFPTCIRKCHADLTQVVALLLQPGVTYAARCE